jgi:NitT/TauT family transport system ATP-binding protein
MQQMASFCMALMLDPDVLLMDEPFASLDPQTREDFAVQLQDVWRLLPKTVLFVTHSMSEAVFLADRIVVLSARPGTVVHIIKVGIPRPRTLGVLKTMEFHRLVDEARDALAEAHRHRS